MKLSPAGSNQSMTLKQEVENKTVGTIAMKAQKNWKTSTKITLHKGHISNVKSMEVWRHQILLQKRPSSLYLIKVCRIKSQCHYEFRSEGGAANSHKILCRTWQNTSRDKKAVGKDRAVVVYLEH